MIDRGAVVRVKRQTELLDLTRSNVYYRPRPVAERDLLLMRRIDELHLEAPYFGARKLAVQLRREGHAIGRKHVRTLMRRMGIEALYRKPRTSIPAREAAIYPYLLENRVIERPNEAWASDITYLPMAHGFLYLMAILDLFSRKARYLDSDLRGDWTEKRIGVDRQLRPRIDTENTGEYRDQPDDETLPEAEGDELINH